MTHTVHGPFRTHLDMDHSLLLVCLPSAYLLSNFTLSHPNGSRKFRLRWTHGGRGEDMAQWARVPSAQAWRTENSFKKQGMPVCAVTHCWGRGQEAGGLLRLSFRFSKRPPCLRGLQWRAPSSPGLHLHGTQPCRETYELIHTKREDQDDRTSRYHPLKKFKSEFMPKCHRLKAYCVRSIHLLRTQVKLAPKLRLRLSE